MRHLLKKKEESSLETMRRKVDHNFMMVRVLTGRKESYLLPLNTGQKSVFEIGL